MTPAEVANAYLCDCGCGQSAPWPIPSVVVRALGRCLDSKANPKADYNCQNPRLSVMTPDGQRHYVVNIDYDGLGGVVLHTKLMKA